MTRAASFRAGTPATPPELRLIDLRGPEGQLVRKITQLEAQRAVESGLGFRRGEHEIRLMAGAVHHDGNPRTWLGSQQAGRVRPSKYAHNQRICNAWRTKQQNAKGPEDNNS